MKIFLGCPKDDDDDKSKVSAAKPIALAKSLSLTSYPSSRICGPRGPHGGGRIRGRGRSHSPMKLRHNAPLASMHWGYALLNNIGKMCSQIPTNDKQNAQESELQGRDEVQTCNSTTTVTSAVTSNTDHFEVEANLTCVPETIAQESELQGRDEVQTCNSTTTVTSAVTSNTDHFEVEATLICVPETREERIEEKDTDAKTCVASDSNKGRHLNMYFTV